jgi:hypothetical protein
VRILDGLLLSCLLPSLVYTILPTIRLCIMDMPWDLLGDSNVIRILPSSHYSSVSRRPRGLELAAKLIGQTNGFLKLEFVFFLLQVN